MKKFKKVIIIVSSVIVTIVIIYFISIALWVRLQAAHFDRLGGETSIIKDNQPHRPVSLN